MKSLLFGLLLCQLQLLVLHIQAQCTVGSFTSSTTVSDVTYMLGTGAQTISTNFVQSASDCAFSWNSIDILQNGSPITLPITESSSTFQIQSTDTQYINTYTGISLRVTINQDTAGTQFLSADTNLFTLTIQACVVSSISGPGTVQSSYTYDINAPSPLSIDLTMSGYTTTPACGFTNSLSGTVDPNGSVQDMAALGFSIASETLTVNSGSSDVQVAPIAVKIYMNSPSSCPSCKFEIESFSVQLTDVCASSTLTSLTIPQTSMSKVEMATPATTQTVVLIDSVGTAKSDQTYCPKTYVLSGPANMADFISISGAVISLQSTKLTDSDNSPYTITVTASLTNHPGQGTQTGTITVTIPDVCTATSFNAGICSDQSMEVWQPTQTYNLDLNTWTDTASASYGNQDGYTLCGSRSMTTNPTSLTAYSYVSYDSNGPKFFFGTTDEAMAGQSVSIDCIISLDNDGSITGTKSFTVSVNACSVSAAQHVPAAGTYPDINYEITTDALETYSIPDFDQSYCQYSQAILCTIGGNGLASVTGFSDVQANSFRFIETDLANTATHTISCQSTLTDSGGSVVSTATKTFQFNVKHPCEYSSFYGVGTHSDVTHQIGSPAITINYAASSYLDTASRDKAGGDNHSYCGARTYNLDLIAEAWVTQPTSTSLKFEGTASAHIGSRTCTLTIGLANYPSITTTQTFTCAIKDACDPPGVSLPTAKEIQNKNYDLGEPQLSISYPSTSTDYVQNPTGCSGLSHSFSVHSDAAMTQQTYTWLTFDQSQINVSTSDVSHEGTHTVYVNYLINSVSVHSHSFTITIVDFCKTSTLTSRTIADITTTALKGTAVDVDGTVKDAISTSHGNNDGTTKCGARTYALSGNNSSLVTLATTTATDDTIRVTSNSASDGDQVSLVQQSYAETLTICLANYNMVPCIDINFNIKVDPCVITAFAPQNAYTTQQFTVFEDTTEKVVNLETYVQTPACGYTMTYKAFIDGTDLSTLGSSPFTLSIGPPANRFKCLSTSLTDVADYSVELRATLNDATSTASTGSTFTYKIIHPCTISELNTNLPSGNTPVTISDMSNTVKAAAVTQTALYQDKITLKHNTAHGVSCGAVTYTLAGEWTSAAATPWLSFNSGSSTLSLQTNDNAHMKSGPGYQVTMDACLTTYPSICAPQQTFEVSILVCVITGYTIDGGTEIADQAYTDAYPAKDVTISTTLTQTPLCGYTGSFTVTSDTAGAVGSWITFDQTKVTIATSDTAQEGTHNIHVTSKLNDAAQTATTDTFVLTVTNPCYSTTLNAETVNDMTTSVLVGSAVTQTIVVKDTMSTNYGNQDGTTLCGSRSYSLSGNNSGFASHSGSTISVTSTTLTDADHPNLLAIQYNESLQACLSAPYTAVTCVTMNFKITINPCIITNFVPASAVVPNQSYTIYDDTSISVNVPQFTQTPSCQYPETTVVTQDGTDHSTLTLNTDTPFSYDYSSTPMTFTINTTNLSLVKTSYAIVITVTLSDSPSTANSDNSFSMTIVHPCVHTKLNEQLPAGSNVVTIADMTTSVKNVNVQQTGIDYLDKQAQIYAAQSLSCGPRTYTLGGDWIDATSTPWMQDFDTPNGTLNLQTDSDSHIKYSAGYQVTMDCCLTNYPTICAPQQTFEVSITECDIITYTVNAGTEMADASYIIGSPQTSLTMTSVLTQNPLCGYTDTRSAVSNPAAALGSWITFDSATNKYTYQTNDTSLTGTYTLTTTWTLNDVTFPSLTSQTDPFVLTLVNPCVTSNIITRTLTDMTTSVKLGSAITQDATTPDQASTTYGAQDGFTICGERTYSLLGGHSFVTLTTTTKPGDTISVQTNTDSDSDHATPAAITYAETLRVCLTDYNTICADMSFNVIIQPCKIVSFASNSLLNNVSRRIYDDPALDIPIPGFTQTPACPYTPTYTTYINGTQTVEASHPVFLQMQTQSKYTVVSTNLAHSGTHTLITTATLDDTFWVSGGTVNQQNTWTLQFINPCTDASVNDAADLTARGLPTTSVITIQDMQTTVKLQNAAATAYEPVTQVFTPFPDNVSVKYGTNPDGICGPRTYTIAGAYVDSTTTPWLTWDEPSLTLGLITQDDQYIAYDGSPAAYPNAYQVTFKVCLTHYPSQCSAVQTFKMAIEECRITALTIDTTQPDVSHNIFTGLISQQIKTYTQTPLCGYTQYYTCSITGPNGNGPDGNPYTTQGPSDCTKRGSPFPAQNSQISWFELDTTSATIQYNIDSNDPSTEGPYTVTQTVLLLAYKYAPLVEKQLSVDWTLTEIDPCQGTTITANPSAFLVCPGGQTCPPTVVSDPIVINTTVKLGTENGGAGTPVLFNFPFHWDSISTQYMPPDGSKICRERVYKKTLVEQINADMTRTTVPGNWLTIDSTTPKLSVMTSSDADLGLFEVVMTVELLHYTPTFPTITLTETFQIKIEPCIILTFTTDSLITTADPYTFNMWSPAVSLSIPTFTQQPSCGYKIEFSQKQSNGLAAPTFQTLIPTTASDPSLYTALQFESTNPNDDLCVYGQLQDPTDPLSTVVDLDTCFSPSTYAYSVVLEAQLVASASSPLNPTQPAAVTLNSENLFKVWAKDICNGATLTPYVPQSNPATSFMFNFIGYDQFNVYNFEPTIDSVSMDPSTNLPLSGIRSGTHLCGQRSYYTKSVAGSSISHTNYVSQFEQNSVQMQLKSLNIADQNTQTVYAYTQLVNYLHVKQFQSFSVTFYGLNEYLPIPLKYYQIGAQKVEIEHQPFIIIPNDGKWTIQYEILVIEKATGLPYAVRPDFVKYIATQRVIEIYTLNAVYETLDSGKTPWQIVIRASIMETAAAGVYSDSIFDLHISLTPPPVSVTDPPYFDGELTKSFTFYYADSWDYTLPNTIDKESDKVEIEIVAIPDFITFEKGKKAFGVIPGQLSNKSQGTYSIALKLKDSSGAISDPYLIQIIVTGDAEVEIDTKDKTSYYADLLISRGGDDAKIPFPKPKVLEFSERGLVKIQWDKDMFRPRSIRDFPNLKTEWTFKDGNKKTVPVMDVQILRGFFSEESDLKFKWEIEKWQGKDLWIQLEFSDPQIISRNEDPEKLMIIFYGEEFFVTNDKFRLPVNGGPDLKEDSVIFYLIPKQKVILNADQLQAKENAKAGSKVAGLLNLVINLTLSASLNQLWSMINTQQIVVMIPLFKLEVPENAQNFFNYIFSVAAFDIIETDSFYNLLLGLDDDAVPDALNDNFEAVGFETVWSIHGLGSLGFAVFSFPILAVFELVLRLFSKNKAAFKLQQKIAKSIYWNFPIRILIEAYTILIVCCLLNLLNLTWDSTGEIILSYFSIFGASLCVLFSIWTPIHLYWNFDKLGTQEFDAKFHALYEGTKLGNIGLIPYQFFFLFRRLILGVLVVISKDVLFYQLAGLVYSGVLAIIIVGQFHPLEQTRANKMDFFNEIMIMLVLYNFMCFNEYQPDLDIRTFMGSIVIGIVAMHITINIIIIGQESIHLQLLKYKRWKLWRKYAKTRCDKIYKFEKRLRKTKMKQQKAKRRAKLEAKENEYFNQHHAVANQFNKNGRKGKQQGKVVIDVNYEVQEVESDGEASNMSFSNQDKNDSIHKQNNKKLGKQPTEAVKAEKLKIEEFNDGSLMVRAAQNSKLGTRKVPEMNTGEVEKQVHLKLSRKMPLDTLQQDLQTFLREQEPNEWKMEEERMRMARGPVESSHVPQVSDLIAKHNLLSNQPNQDTKLRRQKNPFENSNQSYGQVRPGFIADATLRVQPDYKKIHERLFFKSKAGDGTKIQKSFELPQNYYKADPNRDIVLPKPKKQPSNQISYSQSYSKTNITSQNSLKQTESFKQSTSDKMQRSSSVAADEYGASEKEMRRNNSSQQISSIKLSSEGSRGHQRQASQKVQNEQNLPEKPTKNQNFFNDKLSKGHESKQSVSISHKSKSRVKSIDQSQKFEVNDEFVLPSDPNQNMTGGQHTKSLFIKK